MGNLAENQLYYTDPEAEISNGPGKEHPKAYQGGRSNRRPPIAQTKSRLREKPEELGKIDEAVTHLDRTLKRHKKTVPPSLREQVCELVRHWCRQRLKGEAYIHPGVSKMAYWAGVTPRQARTNLGQLKAWGVVKTVGCEQGGKGNATLLIIDILALAHALIGLNTNPSPQLLEKLRKLSYQTSEKVAPSPKIQGPKAEVVSTSKAEVNTEVTSARIRTLRRCTLPNPTNLRVEQQLRTAYCVPRLATSEQLLRKEEPAVSRSLQSEQHPPVETLISVTAKRQRATSELRVSAIQARAAEQAFSEWETLGEYCPDAWI